MALHPAARRAAGPRGSKPTGRRRRGGFGLPDAPCPIQSLDRPASLAEREATEGAATRHVN